MADLAGSSLFAACATAVFIRPYVLRIFHQGLGKALHFLAVEETYNRTVIASNYFEDGFVRRGLGGTIAILLSRHWNYSIWLFIAVSFVSLIVPLLLIIRQLAVRLSVAQATYLALVLALSPDVPRLGPRSEQDRFAGRSMLGPIRLGLAQWATEIGSRRHACRSAHPRNGGHIWISAARLSGNH